MITEKGKALELAIGQIEKRFGQGSIMKLGESAAMAHVEAIPSGSLSLDLALGIGGIPRGRITEIFGPESSGKTTLGQHVTAAILIEEKIAWSCIAKPPIRVKDDTLECHRADTSFNTPPKVFKAVGDVPGRCNDRILEPDP